MPIKIEKERRWLASSFNLQVLISESLEIKQGYDDLSSGRRVRLINDEKALITYKSGSGLARLEDELPENETDYKTAAFVYKGCRYALEKTRFLYQGKESGWTVDVFKNELKGITLIEYEHPDCDKLTILPSWFEGIEVTDSITNSHLARLAYDLKHMTYSGSVRDLLLSSKRLPRIVLTGGPCSGKSTAMKAIESGYGDRVTCMREMATMVITHGVLPSTDKMQSWHFNRFLHGVQSDFQTITDTQARANGKSLLVLDRGSIDNAAYVSGGLPEYEKMCHTTREVEFAKYDMVLFLDTPPRDVYESKKANNPARYETYDEALAVSARIKNVWRNHPGFRVMPNDSWGRKLSEILICVNSFL